EFGSASAVRFRTLVTNRNPKEAPIDGSFGLAAEFFRRWGDLAAALRTFRSGEIRIERGGNLQFHSAARRRSDAPSRHALCRGATRSQRQRARHPVHFFDHPGLWSR